MKIKHEPGFYTYVKIVKSYVKLKNNYFSQKLHLNVNSRESEA